MLENCLFLSFLAKLAKTKLSQQNILSIIFSKIFWGIFLKHGQNLNIMESFLQNPNVGKKARKADAVDRLDHMCISFQYEVATSIL